ncbi:hypothetical protein AVEN_208093-1 [Araneus ventricosus]|uniref:DUF4371 domain-containing protein n=1 Tax=Araneus ventricosus TaxID=182803 RepID=A0A4Y2FZB3_ARAVE|nr:hypothetical protein AVEN_208093-1 [Araneus ventricosus]
MFSRNGEDSPLTYKECHLWSNGKIHSARLFEHRVIYLEDGTRGLPLVMTGQHSLYGRGSPGLQCQWALNMIDGIVGFVENTKSFLLNHLPHDVAVIKEIATLVALTSIWDREQLSIRQASTSYRETAKSLGHDISKISVSKATVYRARAICRSKMAKKIEETLFENPPHFVLHWDSKLLPSVAHGSVKTLEDIVAVLVTRKDFEHLLGVPTLKDTGEQMAEVVIREVDRFGLRDNIIGLSFDTTVSNTGLIQRACTRIEREFGLILLRLPCHHHTHGLILKGVFEECCGIPSIGPGIQIFRKFQGLWSSLDKKSYTTMLDEESPVQGFLEERRVKMVNYTQNVLKDGRHPKEDYKELLQLSLLYLGGWSKNDFSFRIAGALRLARWMAKAIYALKIVLFTKQLNIPHRELKGMKRVAHFVRLIYIRFWHEALVSQMGSKE